MKKPLSLYQGQVGLIQRQRDELDRDLAQVLAEGLNEGYAILDLLYPASAEVNQQEFDL